MRRLTIVALTAGGAALGAAGVGAVGALDGDDDEIIPPIAVPTAEADSPRPQPNSRVGVDDSVPAGIAKPAARIAAAHVGGRALSVDTDDGLYEVDVLRPDGAIVEVLLDGTTVLTVKLGDGDG